MAKITFDPTGTIENFQFYLESHDDEEGTVLILSCDANGFEKEFLDPILLDCKASLLGAICPSIIYNGQKYDTGTLFIKFKNEMDIQIIQDISQKDYARLDADMEAQMNGFDSSIKTMFVFFDGLANNIGICVNALFDNFGLDINYIGGGSGSLSFEQKPSLFTNQGLLGDALIYAFSKCLSSIGVSHGWKSISGPFHVTKSNGTTIQEIDYKPAFEVYKQVVDSYAPQQINKDNFFDIAKSFPFGLNTIADEKIVRDPIILDGTDIICVGSISEGSYIDILNANNTDLISAAKHAEQISHDNLHFEDDFTLFIDCISRVLFLEEHFKDEITAVYNKEKTMVGALTLGEIANNGKDCLAFYNKTAVVGHIGHG